MSDNVIEMIDRAQRDGLDLKTVEDGIKLLTHLRDSKATEQCLKLVKAWHQYSIATSFTLEPQPIEARQQIAKLVRRHYEFQEGNLQLLVMRRLNSVHLKQALIELHQDEKIARVLFFRSSINQRLCLKNTWKLTSI